MSTVEPILTGDEIASTFVRLGISHVIWVPDSTTGCWEQSLEASQGLKLLRVCREGEAWPLAGGLILAGKYPVVIMQTTGLFESGDALRNIVFDLKLPAFGIIGARNWLTENSRDSAKAFTLPILNAWGIPFDVIASAADKHQLETSCELARRENQPRLILLAEGKG